MNDNSKEALREQLLLRIDSICSRSSKLYYENEDIDEIFNFYDELKIYVHNQHKEFNEEFKMDRHKIAACFVAAIINIEPIKLRNNFDSDVERVYIERTSNEQLSFLMGLYIIGSYLVFSEKLNKLDSIELPNGKHGYYITHFCSLLLNNKKPKTKESQYLFVQEYAHIFFLLEDSIIKSYVIKKKDLFIGFFLTVITMLSLLLILVWKLPNPYMKYVFIFCSILSSISIANLIHKVLAIVWPYRSKRGKKISDKGRSESE